jgi:hypothetical protein
MTDNYIQLNKDDRLKLEIKEADGTSTGEYIIFDLEDIELPLRMQEMWDEHKKNRQWMRNQEIIINKREDVKGKKLLSKNQEDMVKAVNEFFKKETEAYNKFLGENGVQKLLNGKPMGWTRLQEIDDIIINVIMPKIEINKEEIKEKIKKIYGNNVQGNKEEVLEEDE